MSNAIGQNATDLAVSGNGVFDFNAAVAKAAKRNAAGLTIAACSLDSSKLFSAVASEYKSMNNIERAARLDSDTVDRINAAIDQHRNDLLARFSTDTVSHRRFAAHKANRKCFVVAEVIRRESAMSMKEQHLFCGIAIRKATERYTKALDENRMETAEKAKKALTALEATMDAINEAMK